MVCSIGIANKWLSNNDAVHFVLYPKQGKTIKGVVQTEYVFLVFFSHDVMTVIFVSQSNETADMFVFQTNPVGVQLFSYVNAFFCSNKFA